MVAIFVFGESRFVTASSVQPDVEAKIGAVDRDRRPSELLTNAVEYGALSVSAGPIRLQWSDVSEERIDLR